MKQTRPNRPVIAITTGDVHGIGPEIIMKALLDAETRDAADFLLIGSATVFEEARARFAPGLEIMPFRGSHRTGASETRIQLIDMGGGPTTFSTGPSPALRAESGELAVNSIKKAVESAMAGEVSAIVTAPISKAAVNAAGAHYPGHTEMLADLTGAEYPVMFFVAKSMRVALVTTHMALREVPEAVTSDKIVRTTRTLNAALLQYFGLEAPSIGVCALNPHAGEGGLFGREEEVIEDALARLRQEGINADGPVPSDTVFVRHIHGEFDAVVSLYHDQAMIPVKLYGMDSGVNVTLGLPIIRTSPDHGTAFDIAWQGRAKPDSMREAVRLAVRMAECRYGNAATCRD